jgi:exonuclease VII small subunit
MKENEAKSDLGSLQLELDDALQALKDAEADERRASQFLCSARNRVTEIQKRLDAMYDLLRKEAPRATIWADQRHQ